MFWTIAGMILWVLATGAVGVGGLSLASVTTDETDSLLAGSAVAVVTILLCVGSVAGIVTVCMDSGWFDDGPPPDGCYHTYTSTEMLPIVAGKVVTYTVYDDTNWVRIACPAG